MICRRCGGNVFGRTQDNDPICAYCGWVYYSSVFNDKRRHYSPEVRQMAVTLKPGRSLSQVQGIIGEQYGEKPTREIIRRWCNGNGKRLLKCR